VPADPMTQDGMTRALADGHRLPLLGLGVWQVPDGPECVDAVRWALDASIAGEYEKATRSTAAGGSRNTIVTRRSSRTPGEPTIWREIRSRLRAPGPHPVRVDPAPAGHPH